MIYMVHPQQPSTDRHVRTWSGRPSTKDNTQHQFTYTQWGHERADPRPRTTPSTSSHIHNEDMNGSTLDQGLHPAPVHIYNELTCLPDHTTQDESKSHRVDSAQCPSYAFLSVSVLTTTHFFYSSRQSVVAHCRRCVDNIHKCRHKCRDMSTDTNTQTHQ